MFTDFIIDILEKEGGYSDHPSDSGGKTMYGITESVAKKHGYYGEMQLLPRERAEEIYKAQFWDPLELDWVSSISDKVAMKVADIGVNMGVYRGAEFLQRSLNVLNRKGRDYEDIKVDGQIGPQTIRALSSFLKKRKTKGEVVLFRALNCLQGAFYITLAERREKDEDFVYGWLLTRVS